MSIRRLAAIFLLAACSLAQATSTARVEIDSLLARLQASGCQFNRNGSWYSSSEARDHLLRKLDYLEGRGNIQSTEQFIQLAASTSSSSGKAYLVRCGNDTAEPSQQWLSRELANLRQRH